tara:strand:+ start:1427 stop:1639 length:213 start_codon:yes stop_codon:yes gene_type:complete
MGGSRHNVLKGSSKRDVLNTVSSPEKSPVKKGRAPVSKITYPEDDEVRYDVNNEEVFLSEHQKAVKTRLQ